jgi:hypothetical protein
MAERGHCRATGAVGTMAPLAGRAKGTRAATSRTEDRMGNGWTKLLIAAVVVAAIAAAVVAMVFASSRRAGGWVGVGVAPVAQAHWSRVCAACPNDTHHFVSVDTVTGRFRFCGNVSAYCGIVSGSD